MSVPSVTSTDKRLRDKFQGTYGGDEVELERCPRKRDDRWMATLAPGETGISPNIIFPTGVFLWSFDSRSRVVIVMIWMVNGQPATKEGRNSSSRRRKKELAV